ncbi:uncharacterized protein GGS22DRAFT_149142 [Annulohypoxylon maeteangense]|uniref:uncharacterized protein n=1 Tax=Annulohypoxylon maeteangense TaxID=1927788 RepID=UPI00200759BD|nr:uncharacterized protein GGS22DRAFT_149142 [Annulohypoxylon maeteangense]KAI0889777.1 hypothetical protein GGS22DRAFT_149142 [Annulohypoxylon maeteangense]
MSLDTFHLFPLLPPELRRAIYLLATPPRIVHLLEESERGDLFESRINDIESTQFKFHSSFSAYEEEFRFMVSLYAKPIMRGEMENAWYGIGMDEEIRDIFPSWLLSYAHILERFLRKCRLYSKAPIPTLLHTCVESRDVLINAGYQLAFGTRDHEPMTWFNFENDVLCPDYTAFLKVEPYPSALAEYCDSIGSRIDEDSLRKVRRVLISSTSLLSQYCAPTIWVACLVRLLPKLDRLYLVEWDADLFSERLPTLPDPDPVDTNDQEQGSIDTYNRELWKYTPVEGMDVLFEAYGGYPYISNGRFNRWWQNRLSEIDSRPTAEHFQSLVDRSAQWLEAKRDAVLKEEPDVDPWPIPKVEVVHLCTESIARQLFSDRQEVWKRYISSEKGDSVSTEFYEKWPVSKFPPSQELIIGP